MRISDAWRANTPEALQSAVEHIRFRFDDLLCVAMSTDRECHESLTASARSSPEPVIFQTYFNSLAKSVCELVIAGSNDGNQDNASCTGELFSNGQWHLTSALPDCVVFGDDAALLPNGDVLIDGGGSASEFYDPSTNVWQATMGRQSLNIPQRDPLALLATGKVLLAGLGASANHMFISKAALYEPSTNKWRLTGSMHQLRRGHTLTRLLNGQVLAAGGQRPAGDVTLSSAELYTP